MAGSSIRRVLVANRGEIARRVFATCRRLGIATVAVYSEPDADAAFVREADVAVALGGAAPAESYLRGDAVLDAARRAGADAVHPGYGFLAENAAFAEAVVGAGLRWIGPSPAAIAAMGSKTEARDRMERAGVPVLPGARLDGEAGLDLARLADHVGYPLLVKASAGGGGKGMRLVREPELLAEEIAAARREARASFGDDTLLVERWIEENALKAGHPFWPYVDRLREPTFGTVKAADGEDLHWSMRTPPGFDPAASAAVAATARTAATGGAPTAAGVRHGLR